MIELNLLEKKNPIRLPSIMGLDLTAINFKMIGISIFIFYVPEIFIHSHFDGEVKDQEEILSKTSTASEKAKKEIGKKSDLKSQLDAYNLQVEKLKSRSAQVDEILKIRTNPKKILEKVAKSIPEDLWFDQFKISENQDVLIIGGATSPRSIGEFITVINDSPFFGNSISPVKQENKQENRNGEIENFEYFELKGKVKNYEMRSR